LSKILCPENRCGRFKAIVPDIIGFSSAILTLARKIAAITLIVWKKEVRFDANYLKPQAV